VETEIEQIKKQLAFLARQKKSRIVPWEKDLPKKWWFSGVIDPRSNMPFTPDGAWDFIAEKLEERGTTIEEITLDKPQGKKAYVLHVDTVHGEIYIKVHFGEGNTIVGRSFHYSNDE
jgi:hypothetical protein